MCPTIHSDMLLAWQQALTLSRSVPRSLAWNQPASRIGAKSRESGRISTLPGRQQAAHNIIRGQMDSSASREGAYLQRPPPTQYGAPGDKSSILIIVSPIVSDAVIQTIHTASNDDSLPTCSCRRRRLGDRREDHEISPPATSGSSSGFQFTCY